MSENAIKPTSMTKIWLGQIRAPFLILSLLLSLIGAAIALNDNVFHGLNFALATLGVILAHVAVNLFNELSDYRSKIDEHTQRTPFSGGSGTLQAGWLRPKQVARIAWASLVIGFLIGLYLSYDKGFSLLIFVVLGGLASYFYTSHLSRWMLGEFTAGTTLGAFVVMGTYFAQAGQITTQVVLISIPPGILTALLLLLNEFPDLEADKQGGRRHLVIRLGRKKAAWLYTMAVASMYLFIIGGVFVAWFPPILLIALLTLPLAVKSTITAIKHGDKHESMIPALGSNVGLVLGTDLLLAVAFFIQSGLR